MTNKGLKAILNNGIEFFIGSLILVLVTKLYSIEEAGVWIVFVTILYVGTKFREGITQTSLMKFSVGVSKNQKMAVYWLSIAITFSVELLLGLIAIIVSYIIEDQFLPQLLKGYIWLALPQSLFRLFQFISQSRLDVDNMVASNLILLNMVFMVLLFVYSTSMEFVQLPIALSVAYWVALCWQLLMHNVLNWEFNMSKFSIPEGYLEFALNGVLRELFGTISSRAYIFLTVGLVGYTESALVGIASRYVNLIYLPNSAYQGLLYPKACSMVNNGALRTMIAYYRRSVSWMQAGFLPYVVALLTFGSLGIVLLHGEEYVAAIPFYTVLILSGAFIAPFGNAFGSVCQALNRPDLVTKLVVFNSSVNLILSYLLISIFGVWGAVLAPIITDIIGLWLISIILKRVFNSKITVPFTNIIQRLFILNSLMYKSITLKLGVVR